MPLSIANNGDGDLVFTVPTVSEDELARITAELRRTSVDASEGAYEDAAEFIAELAELVDLGELDQSNLYPKFDGPPEVRFFPRIGGLR